MEIMKYLILQNPGHNRVYYNSAGKLALAELEIATTRFSSTCTNIEIVEIESIRYLSFETESNLSENDLEIISRLSFIFAIYKKEEFNDKICLLPIKKKDYEYIDSKINTILKYPGKTNELFTKMMLNVALLSSNFTYDDEIQLLDPLAGKATTLFEGLVYGFDSYGIEIESKPISEATLFFKKFIENERIKHTVKERQIYGTNKSDTIMIREFQYAKNSDDFKAKKNLKKLALIHANTQEAFKCFKKEKFNLIVGDLPYGIFHGNNDHKKSKKNNTRNPLELLAKCLPEWYKVMKKSASIVLAWNSFVVPQKQIYEIFAENGFEVLTAPPYQEFEHMVDKSIKRNIVVAKKN